MSVFDDTTIAAIQSYYPDRKDAAGFLKVFKYWWTISNSKERYNSHNKLGHAITNGDKKIHFIRSLADWLEAWQQEKIPNCENFQLSKQTSSALIRTIRCHAALAEDLLTEDNYSYVLTARLQSDPLERRYGQYRQMSGGKFLVSLREIETSEKILKLKSLMKENCAWSDSLDKNQNVEETLMFIDSKISDLNTESLMLEQDSREVAVFLSGYIAKKLMNRMKSCCADLLIGTNEDEKYLQSLSRGGLLTPSQALSDYVSFNFALLDEVFPFISQNSLPARLAVEYFLEKLSPSLHIACDKHLEYALTRTNRICANIFLNNERKRKSAAVSDDRVKQFKKLKRSI